jgi:hypothetical protein
MVIGVLLYLPMDRNTHGKKFPNPYHGISLLKEEIGTLQGHSTLEVDFRFIIILSGLWLLLVQL